jgi:ABC-type antimicrobial peptide transport system permease subunit
LIFAVLLLVYNALDNVAHRVDEVGVMKAIGWRNVDVGRLFMAEAAYAGLAGGLIGSILGSVAGAVYGQFADLKLPATLNYFPACSTTDAPLALPLSTNPSLEIFLLGMVSALVIGTIAGLAASRRAARLDPVDALRRL